MSNAMNNVKNKIQVKNVCKTFTLHTQNEAIIPVFDNVSFAVDGGNCLILSGPSGAGKSTLLKALYANYKVDSGNILVTGNGNTTDITKASVQTLLKLRQSTLGYVSQFLRVIPRVSVLDLVKEPLLQIGADDAEAGEQAKTLLARLNIPESLWSLAPATFSGGEKQRVNIAISMIRNYPVLLLDEPTASLDAANKRVVIELISKAKNEGSAIVGIFHDQEVREAIEDDSINITQYKSLLSA